MQRRPYSAGGDEAAERRRLESITDEFLMLLHDEYLGQRRTRRRCGKNMMRFVTVDPTNGTLEEIEADAFETAVEAAGLKRGETDIGIVSPGVAIVVYEFGLYVPREEARYFAIRDQLFAGKALLYGFNNVGETIDLRAYPVPTFFDSWQHVEAAITAGFIRRPRMTVNGQEVWRWPQPRVM
jgi:hypothetical protein